MTITEKNLAEKLKGLFLRTPIDDKPWEQIARRAAEELGVDLAPEPKPLPTEPGSAIIATEVRGQEGEWRAFLGPDGYWVTPERVNGSFWHRPDQVTAWTPARVVPVTAAPVTLTEDQVGEVWDQECGRGNTRLTWAMFSDRWKRHIAATANATLAQYATHAEEAT